jgi:hypothetical protein
MRQRCFRIVFIKALFLFGDFFLQCKDFLLNFQDRCLLIVGILLCFCIKLLKCGLNGRIFLMLGGFFLLLLVFDEKDLILDFFYDKFEVNVFLGLILNCESEFVDGVFQELESKLVLAFQLNVKNSPDGNLHLVRIN